MRDIYVSVTDGIRKKCKFERHPIPKAILIFDELWNVKFLSVSSCLKGGLKHKL